MKSYQRRPLTAKKKYNKLLYDLQTNTHFLCTQTGEVKQANKAGDLSPKFAHGISGVSNYKHRKMKSQYNQNLKCKQLNIDYQKQKSFISPHGTKFFGYSQSPYKTSKNEIIFLTQKSFKLQKQLISQNINCALTDHSSKNLKNKSSSKKMFSYSTHQPKYHKQQQEKKCFLSLKSIKKENYLHEFLKKQTFFQQKSNYLQKNIQRKMKKKPVEKNIFDKFKNNSPYSEQSSQLKSKCFKTIKSQQNKQNKNSMSFQSTFNSNKNSFTKSCNFFYQALQRSRPITYQHSKSTFQNCYNKKCHNDYSKQIKKYQNQDLMRKTIGICFHKNKLKIEKQQNEKLKILSNNSKK